MTTRLFSTEWLYDNDIPHGEFVKRDLIDQQRWSVIYEIVFEYGGDLYMIDWEEPATEYQEVYRDKYTKATLVDKKEIVAYEYVPSEKTINLPTVE